MRSAASTKCVSAFWEPVFRPALVPNEGFPPRFAVREVVYRSHPFRDALNGHAGVFEYSRWAFDSEADVDLWFGEPTAAGDRASVEYWAVILDQHGKISTLAGTVVLRFAPDGRVAEHRDYWALEDGRRAPYDGWAGQTAS